jgi:hypothetical protein
MNNMNLCARVAIYVPHRDHDEEIGLEFLIPAPGDDLTRADIRTLEQMPKLSASTDVGDMTVTISLYPDDASLPGDRARCHPMPVEVPS